MADDWAKLIAEAKKLDSKYKDLNDDDGKALWKALQTRDKAMEQHEKALQKAAITAYEAGVGSKKVEEFQKHKVFATAFKALQTDGSLLKAELKQFETYVDKCNAAAKVVGDMVGVMDKALQASKGKDKSAERTAAKKMRDYIFERRHEMNSVAILHYQLDKYLTDFDSNFDKIVAHLIAEAFKKGKDPAEAAEIPQPLTEKKLQSAMKECHEYSKVVQTCIDKLIDMTPADLAFDTLNAKAWSAHDSLRSKVGEIEALFRKFKNELVVADPKDEVAHKVKAITKIYDDAHAALVKADKRVGKVK